MAISKARMPSWATIEILAVSVELAIASRLSAIALQDFTIPGKNPGFSPSTGRTSLPHSFSNPSAAAPC
ncbi:hypothetical protein ASE03_20835 [Kitasatospora sp. Root187]|nr:hypothetical protein ASE03_20835 [Kitasatospora sp. Root187]